MPPLLSERCAFASRYHRQKMKISYKNFKGFWLPIVFGKEGIVQPFPNHFHEHYVIGFVENGERCLSYRNIGYTIGQGNVVLFNPGDNHACVQSDDGALDYRGFNISKKIMLGLTEDVAGKRELPGFSENVICDHEVICYLRPLHEMMMNGNNGFLCSSMFFCVFYPDVICLLWLYGSFFRFFAKFTDHFVEWHRYDYSVLWFSDMHIS